MIKSVTNNSDTKNYKKIIIQILKINTNNTNSKNKDIII